MTFKQCHDLNIIQQSRAILSNSNISSYSPYTQARTLDPPMSGVSSVLGQASLRASAVSASATGCHLPSSRHTSPLMSSSLPSGIGKQNKTKY